MGTRSPRSILVHDLLETEIYSESGRSVPPMFSIFKIESYLYWILFSLEEEIIEHSCSLWFPRKGTPIEILHLQSQWKKYLNLKEANNKAIFE